MKEYIKGYIKLKAQLKYQLSKDGIQFKVTREMYDPMTGDPIGMIETSFNLQQLYDMEIELQAQLDDIKEVIKDAEKL
jgi:hypothetical protein